MADYQRLPGRGGTIYRHSLWLGKDHVLSIINRGYSEDYKRFYYRDIRAIQIRRTLTYAVINSVFGAFLGICGLVHVLAALVWGWSEDAQAVFGILTGFFGMIFLLNLIFGPSCATRVYTAVHSESLPSLNRMRPTGKTIRLLRERIEAVQGSLSPEDLQSAQGPDASSSFSERVARPAFQEDQIEEYSGNFHWSLFAVLLFNALLTVVTSFVRHSSLMVVSAALYLVLGICMIGALIRQRRSRMGKGLRRLAWFSTIYVWFISVVGSMAAVFILFTQEPDPGRYGYQDMVKAMLDTLPADHLPLLILSLFSAACSLALGLAGIVLMMQYRKETV